MSKDTRFQGLPGRLALAAAAALVTSSMAYGAMDEQSSSSSSQTQQSAQQSSYPQDSSQQGSEALDKLAQQESQLSEFVKAVEKAGMANALTSGTTYTIFAPTNDAFDSSDQDIKDLMESGNQQKLVEVLRAHIVADDVDPDMAKKIGKAKTVGGSTIALTTDGDTLKVDDAKVVKSDIQEGNLRIYAIDSVLSPATSAMASTGTSGASDQPSSSMAAADFDNLDEDSDGYLSDDELQAQQSLADEKSQMDSDSDGRVSRSEFAAFEQGSGSSSSMGNGSDHSSPMGSQSGRSSTDTSTDDRSDSDNYSDDQASADTSAQWGSDESTTERSSDEWSSAANTNGAGEMAAADFDQLDTDGDGYLSDQEVQASQDLAAAGTEQLDTNSDGKVSRTEFAAFEQSSSTMPSAGDQQSTTPDTMQPGTSSQMPPHNEGDQVPQP